MAWGAIPEYLLAKVREVTMVPASQDRGLLGSSAPALVGPSEGHTSSPGFLVPPQPRAQLLGSHTIAPVSPASTCGLCRRGQASGQPSLLFLLGEGAGSDSPAPGRLASISMPHGPSEGHHCPPNPCFIAPPAVSHSPGLVWPASITMTHRPSEGHSSSPSLCSVAPLRCGCRR